MAVQSDQMADPDLKRSGQERRVLRVDDLRCPKDGLNGRRGYLLQQAHQRFGSSRLVSCSSEFLTLYLQAMDCQMGESATITFWSN